MIGRVGTLLLAVLLVGVLGAGPAERGAPRGCAALVPDGLLVASSRGGSDRLSGRLEASGRYAYDGSDEDAVERSWDNLHCDGLEGGVEGSWNTFWDGAGTVDLRLRMRADGTGEARGTVRRMLVTVDGPDGTPTRRAWRGKVRLQVEEVVRDGRRVEIRWTTGRFDGSMQDAVEGSWDN